MRRRLRLNLHLGYYFNVCRHLDKEPLQHERPHARSHVLDIRRVRPSHQHQSCLHWSGRRNRRRKAPVAHVSFAWITTLRWPHQKLDFECVDKADLVAKWVFVWLRAWSSHQVLLQQKRWVESAGGGVLLSSAVSQRTRPTSISPAAQERKRWLPPRLRSRLSTALCWERKAAWEVGIRHPEEPARNQLLAGKGLWEIQCERHHSANELGSLWHTQQGVLSEEP